MSEGLRSYTGVVHPWMCDVMGHMNVRHYAAIFDDASFQLLGHLAGPDPTPGLGWADVRLEIDYRHETRAGDLICVTSWVERCGRSSVTYVQSLRGSLDGRERARARTVSARFDLVARRSAPLEEGIRSRARDLLLPDVPEAGEAQPR